MTAPETFTTRALSDRAGGVIALGALATIVIVPIGSQLVSTALTRITIDQAFLTAVLFPLGYATTALILGASVFAVVAGVQVTVGGGALRILGAGVALVGAVQFTVLMATQVTALAWRLPHFPTIGWL